MGTDNLFHKRKAKADSDTRRRKSSRESYDKVLIVCEGQKTEPYYFSELIDHYEIHSANVRISGECGSDPVSVVEHSFQLYQDERTSGSGPFDRVYCVFDRDTHSNYQQALDKLTKRTPKNTFRAIPSVPCFEYWLLLNFDYSTAPYRPVGGLSVGEAVLKQLRIYWPSYDKANTGTFTHTLHIRNDELAYALANSKRALAEAKNHATDNPSTYVHELVEYLQNIKKDYAT